VNEEKLKEIYRQQRTLGCFLDWEEWKDKVTKAYSELVEVARRGSLITYGELGIGKLRISLDWLYPKIGWVVGACSVYEWREGRSLISALVVSSKTNRPGKGFWGLPGIPSQLRMHVKVGSTERVSNLEIERDEFWAKEVDKTHKQWQRKGSEGCE